MKACVNVVYSFSLTPPSHSAQHTVSFFHALKVILKTLKLHLWEKKKPAAAKSFLLG